MEGLSGAASLPSLLVTKCDDGEAIIGWVPGLPLGGWVAGQPPGAERPNSGMSGYSGSWNGKPRPTGSSQQLHDLRTAAMAGRDDLITSILDAGVCVDQTLRQGWTALMFAASSAQPSAVKLLLDRGADPNRHKELFTPLMAVCGSSVKDSVTSSNDNLTYGSTAPAGGNQPANADGSTVDLATDDKVSAVSSSESRLVACVELLLERGAAVDAAERHRMTPLMFAAKGGLGVLINTLIKRGADTTALDNKGWSALCWSCHCGHGACVRLLLTQGADASVTTHHGQTPADIARSQQFMELAEVVESVALGTPISAPRLPSTATSCPPPPHCSDLDMVLAGLGLSHLANTFAKHQIELAGFLRLTTEDFTRLGVAEVGLQQRLLAAIAEMHRKAWQPTSMTSLTTKPYISLVDATNMLGNVNKHVTFLEATLAFLREQLETQPAAQQLHHNTTDTTVHTLVTAANDAAVAMDRLHNTTLYLSKHLTKVSQCATHLPSDLIGCCGPDPPRVWGRRVGGAAAVSAVVLTGLLLLKPALLSALFGLAPRAATVVLDY